MFMGQIIKKTYINIGRTGLKYITSIKEDRASHHIDNSERHLFIYLL